MPLSTDDLRLLDAACGARDNEAARILQNAFGLTTAKDIMVQIASSPITVRSDLMDQVRLAIAEQKRRHPADRSVLRSASA